MPSFRGGGVTMKNLFNSAIAAYRCYSSRPSYKILKFFQSSSAKSKKWDTVSTRPRRTRVKWTEEQNQILDAISRGESVFITGSAGTGKTLLLKHIIKKLQRIHSKNRVYVTASTGMAACAIYGQTLHSFAGTGLVRDEDRETLLKRVLYDKKAYRRWARAKALVVDEASMVDGEYFDNHEYIARRIRSNFNPDEERIWGGIQLVVTADFLQLPPIISKGRKCAKVFAFQADCWDATFHLQIELTKIFRQTEAQLIRLLQGVRKGETQPEDLQVLEQCCSASEPNPSAVQLFPRNEDVNRVNRRQMESLNEHIVVYNALDSGENPWRSQLNQGIAPERLELCRGARVMLNKNLDTYHKLVNGATGTIMHFCLDYKFKEKQDRDMLSICEHGNYLPVVKFDSGLETVIGLETWVVMDGEKVAATRKQVPLILAWALSIHKCQGMTLDSVHTDLQRAFGYGMVYVALSRVKSLAGLHLSGFNPSKVKAHPKVLQFYKKFSTEKDEQDEHAVGLR